MNDNNQVGVITQNQPPAPSLKNSDNSITQGVSEKEAQINEVAAIATEALNQAKEHNLKIKKMNSDVQESRTLVYLGFIILLVMVAAMVISLVIFYYQTDLNNYQQTQLQFMQATKK